MKDIISIISLATLLCGCSIFSTDNRSSGVAIVNADETSFCRKISNITAQVNPTFLAIPKSSKTIQDELFKVAKVNALSLQGDSLVPVSVVFDGRQDYYVYRCKP